MAKEEKNKINPENDAVPGRERPVDFIREIVIADKKNNKHEGRVHTRFPPEPNGYLHIGHAKAISIDFGIAEEFGGLCNLRFDDTNPEKEDVEYVDSIREDIRWLGFDWQEREYYASDYFDRLYEYAVTLVKKGRAYVDNLSPDQIREYRGTLTESGKNSPFRSRPVKENLELFEKMKNGEFEDGACVLRAKIDMSHPNLNMRDPTIYRIKKTSHHRTGDKWCIYPMYDFTHCLSDSIEGITHSFCTLEFEDHRLLYDWFIDELGMKNHPQQIEFARLNLTYTVMSKRKLLELVNGKYVSGWDDPRMPTISGMRRRGYTPTAIRNFCERIGVSKVISTVDIALLEYFIREELNRKAQRAMAVLKPLKVVIDNYPADQEEWFDADNNPEDESAGKRKIPFSNVVYIEEEDFRENPPKKYYRLSPGQEIRLKHAYYIRCTDVVKDPATGKIIEIHCTYDPESKGGWTNDGRKVLGTSHWVSAKHAVTAEVRLYNHLFVKEDPLDVGAFEDWKQNINPDSLEIVCPCLVEASLKQAQPGDRFQFLRQGYFCVDPDSTKEHPVFNRIVSLKDSWAKIEKSGTEKQAGE